MEESFLGICYNAWKREKKSDNRRFLIKKKRHILHRIGAQYSHDFGYLYTLAR